ncbi:hypothetical protein COV16_00640 [Candidatus Woesearchaeota archaeon CG10_big_fil_rev_8_21_14_0_10_34_8]|nr:MAG: hypothetical protein COV16_00640 [Candidatus Woesearchaeota archaeon CG10_big_fil_rev_8_21_14_0_10_34_8]
MNKSIVTSFYNRKLSTLEVIDKMFLPSLVNNADSDTEVVIIDDCSPLEKETKELVEKHLPDLKRFGKVVFKRNSKNLGFAGSFNRGIKIASGNRLFEDLDLGKRMSQKYSVVINPKIFVYHGRYMEAMLL